MNAYNRELEEFEEPPAPDNPDFEELHTEAQQNEIARRFAKGIALRELNDSLAKRKLTPKHRRVRK